MHITKKRVLLILALALMAVLVALPATASAATPPYVQINNGAAYTGTTTVDLSYDVPNAAPWTGVTQVSFADSTNGGVTWSAETALQPYTIGTVGMFNSWALPIAPTTLGQVVTVRATFYNVLNAVVNVPLTTTITYEPGVVISALDFAPFAATGVTERQGLYWFGPTTNGGNVEGNFSTVPPPITDMAYFTFSLDGAAGVQVPDATDVAFSYVFDPFLTLQPTTGVTLHTVLSSATTTAPLTGPTTTTTFGTDSQAPTLVTSSFSSSYVNAAVNFSALVTDNAGSGVAPTPTVTLTSGTAVLSNVTVTPLSYDPWQYTITGTLTPATGIVESDVLTFAATDEVGNVMSTAETVKFDTQHPTTSYSITPTGADTFAGWTNQNVTLTFNATNYSGSGVAYTEYIEGDLLTVPPSTASTGTKLTGTPTTAGNLTTTLSISQMYSTQVKDGGPIYIWYRSVDAVGNMEPWNLVRVFYDNAGPVVSINYPGDAPVWFNSPFTLTLTATDNNSGLAVNGLTWDVPNWNTGTLVNPAYGWNTWQPGQQSPAIINFNTVPSPLNDGIFTMNYKATDVAGNTTTGTQTINVDTRAPVTTPSGSTMWIPGGSNNFTLTATDQASGSGVAATWYRVDQATKWTVNTGTGTNPASPQTQAPVTLATPITIAGADGSVHTVDFASVDNSVSQAWWNGLPTSATTVPFPGNAEATIGYVGQEYILGGYKTETVKIDSVAPTTTVAGADSAWHAGPVTLFFTATDAQSGVAETQWSIDGVNWTNGDQATISTNGTDVVSYRSIDNVGNVEATNTVTVNVDTDGPGREGLQRHREERQDQGRHRLPGERHHAVRRRDRRHQDLQPDQDPSHRRHKGSRHQHHERSLEYRDAPPEGQLHRRHQCRRSGWPLAVRQGHRTTDHQVISA